MDSIIIIIIIEKTIFGYSCSLVKWGRMDDRRMDDGRMDDGWMDRYISFLK